ncbi:MAG: glycosyltransferase family 61 protein [Pseudomonadota bacterium]
MDNKQTTVRIKPYTAAQATLVTAPSYLIDRIVPDVEQILLPERASGGGTLRFGPRRLSGAGQPPRRRVFGRAQPVMPLTGAANFDFRRNEPTNWAHFLTNHLPVFFHICDEMGIDAHSATILMPANTPGFIQRAAAFFGLTLALTDAPVDGDGIDFDFDPWIALRAERAAWVRGKTGRAALARGLLSGKDTVLPTHVFLSRRNTRALKNEAEVADYLAPKGFQTIYPEDLSVADQFRLFNTAQQIVAIHGAGLAPLLYRRPNSALKALVEILPCGHMTDYYRVMADQVGVPWVGVRGRIKAAYVAPAYALKRRFKKYSLDNFEVDVASIERAFALLPDQRMPATATG